MDLLDVRGVGPATKERLAWAGIRAAEDLARVHDVQVVSEWTGIPAGRLATLVAAAVEATAPRPPREVLQSMTRAVSKLFQTLTRGLAG